LREEPHSTIKMTIHFILNKAKTMTMPILSFSAACPQERFCSRGNQRRTHPNQVGQFLLSHFREKVRNIREVRLSCKFRIRATFSFLN
jgi:hypothetical protein